MTTSRSPSRVRVWVSFGLGWPRSGQCIGVRVRARLGLGLGLGFRVRVRVRVREVSDQHSRFTKNSLI